MVQNVLGSSELDLHRSILLSSDLRSVQELYHEHCYSTDIPQLKQQIAKLNAAVDAVSGRLVRSLDKRDHLTSKLLQKFDVLTAILKSLSMNISGSTYTC